MKITKKYVLLAFSFALFIPFSLLATEPENDRELRRQLAKQYSSTANMADNIIIPDDLLPAFGGNVLETIVGRVPGVQVYGMGAFTRAYIRGSRRPALIVVDGIQGNSSLAFSIAPQDVATIEIHRAAFSASWWGMRGGSGVIVINTKRGDWP